PSRWLDGPAPFPAVVARPFTSSLVVSRPPAASCPAAWLGTGRWRADPRGADRAPETACGSGARAEGRGRPGRWGASFAARPHRRPVSDAQAPDQSARLPSKRMDNTWSLAATSTRLAEEDAVALVAEHRETALRGVDRVRHEGEPLLRGGPLRERLRLDEASF